MSLYRPDVQIDITIVTDTGSDVTASDAGDGGDATASDASDVTASDAASDGSDASTADASDGASDAGCNAVCDGGCVNTLTDPRNCGGCGMVCPAAPANAAITCTMGRCNTPMQCLPGFADCDGLAGNGCEVNIGTNPDHCGMCRRVCPSAPNANAACLEGNCGLACVMGFGDCDGNAANGCEIDIRRTATHCAACGRVCTLGRETLNASPACVDSACSFACGAGWGDCDGMRANGCETDVTTDRRNCGACGTACDAPNASGSCVAGRCAFTCNTGFGDCDGLAANGCEVNLNNTIAHCGRCGNVCPNAVNGTPTCSAGACAYVCNGGYGDCDGVRSNGCETDTTNNAEHCSRCGNVCPGYVNGVPSCIGSTCRPTCTGGYGNCDGDSSNGCEIDTRTNPRHCGVCGRVCPSVANAMPACAGGGCTVVCNTGFGDCDSDLVNGCETDVRTSPRHCGMCGRTCTLPHAVEGCAASTCTVVSCESGFSNCDGDAANGCETEGPCVTPS